MLGWEGKWRAVPYRVIKEHLVIWPSQKALGIKHDPPPTTITFKWRMALSTGVYRETLKCEALLWFPKPVTHRRRAARNELRDLEAYSDLCLHSPSQNCPNILSWPQFCKLHKWPKIPFSTTIWKPQDIFINRFLHGAPMRTWPGEQQSYQPFQLKVTEKMMALRVVSWRVSLPTVEKLRKEDP